MSGPKDSRDGRFGRQPENMALPNLLRALASGENARKGGYDMLLQNAAAELEEAWDEIDIGATLIADAAIRLQELELPIRAHGMRLGQCSNPECKLVHLALTDEDDFTLATAVIKSGELRQMIRWCREAGIEP